MVLVVVVAVVVVVNTKMDDHDLRLDQQYDWAHGVGDAEKNSVVGVDADDIDIDFVVVVKRQEVEHSHDSSYWKNIGTVVDSAVAAVAVHHH